MRYLMMIYTREDLEDPLPPAEIEKIKQGHMAVLTGAGGKGILQAVERLGNTSTATTVRANEGNVVITDGPFAETKEQLAGFYVIDCENLDEAIEWAAQIPTGCGGGEGSIEIRPMAELSGVFADAVSKFRGREARTSA